tara:strand:+ start:403 stop:930 length:528 start_codon:yes stop_codon:yes gene_type:complete
MKNIFKILFVFLILNTFSAQKTLADAVYFIDFKKILNTSDAGKKAQTYLQNKLKSDLDRFKKEEKKLRDDEKQLISQKKIVTNEVYQTKLTELRKQVAKLQKDKKSSFDKITKQRNEAKNQLLSKLNPIMKKHMKENKIRVVVDKSIVLLGDQDLDLTSKIIEILNIELKSINLK